MIYRCCCCLH